jgi:hypothetical protein
MVQQHTALRFLAKIRKKKRKKEERRIGQTRRNSLHLNVPQTPVKSGFSKPREAAMDKPVIFLHGFSEKVLFDLIGAVKEAARKAGIDPGHIAFASSTPTNLNWKICDLIREVRQEHQMLQKKT